MAETLKPIQTHLMPTPKPCGENQPDPNRPSHLHIDGITVGEKTVWIGKANRSGMTLKEWVKENLNRFGTVLTKRTKK